MACIGTRCRPWWRGGAESVKERVRVGEKQEECDEDVMDSR